MALAAEAVTAARRGIGNGPPQIIDLLTRKDNDNMRAKAIDVEETQTVFEWVEFEDDHEPYFFGVLELQNGQLLYGIFGEDVDTNEYATPLALARNEDVAKQIANILNGAIAHIAALTAERDALKAENAAIRQVNERVVQDEILLTEANEHLSDCVTAREMVLANLWTIVNDETDPYTAQKIYQRFRLWEESIPRR